jgi:hypothetical protein
MQIRTNHVPRHVIYGYELSVKERAGFDYIAEDELDARSFVRYRGVVYDLGDFQTTRGLPTDSPLGQWDGFQSDSFFSGVAVRYAPGFESVVCGTFAV